MEREAATKDWEAQQKIADLLANHASKRMLAGDGNANLRTWRDSGFGISTRILRRVSCNSRENFREI